MQVLSKPQKNFSVDIKIVYLKFIHKGTGPQIAKNNLAKKNKVGGISLLNIKPYDTNQDSVVLVVG